MNVARSVIFLLALAPAFAQTSRIDQVLTQLEQVRSFSGVSISPDGKWVAWTLPTPEDNGNSEIYLADSKGAAKARRITAGDGTASLRESGVAWSPDSSRIAFFSNAGCSPGAGFRVAGRWWKGSASHRRDGLCDGYPVVARWQDALAFLYAENGGGGGPLEAVPAQVGAIESEIHNQRLTIANAAGGEIRQVSPAQLNIYEYDWSPDGNRFAAIAAPGPADNNWWIAQLYTVDIKSGQMNVLYHPPGGTAACRAAMVAGRKADRLHWRPDE